MQPSISRLLSFFIFVCVAAAAPAQNKSDADAEIAEADRAAIRSIIQAQLDAFRADDAAAAFSFASPSIQDQFGSPERFMIMVKGGYGPVYHNRQAFFQETVRLRGVVAQKVLIVDHSNTSVTAIYPMQRQSDGSWRIDGCYLSDDGGQTI